MTIYQCCRYYSDKRCSRCDGWGWNVFDAGSAVCACVFRSVFRECLARWHLIGWRLANGQPPRLARSARRTWGFADLEWRADWELLARRYLSRKRKRIFRMVYLEGRNWREVAARVGLNRGNFWHEAYRVEEVIGGLALLGGLSQAKAALPAGFHIWMKSRPKPLSRAAARPDPQPLALRAAA